MIKKKASKKVYENPYFSVFEDDVIYADGSEGKYFVLDDPEGFVKVIPFDGEKYILVRQFRYTTGSIAWAFPAGSIDAGESPEAAAKRELEEEADIMAQMYYEKI